MRISRKIKRLWNAFLTVFLVSICLFGSLLAFRNASIDLSKLDVARGQVIDTGVMQSSTTTANGIKIGSQIFFVRIVGVNQILAVYYHSQNYSALQHAIQVGDTISVYYKTAIEAQNPNLSTYQIKKDNKILLDQEEYRGKEEVGGYMILVAAFAMGSIGVWQDRKYWKKKKQLALTAV